MSDVEYERNEEEIAEMVADALNDLGFSAYSQDTGGGTICVVLQRNAGGEIIWGTADFNWGASIIDQEGEIESSLETMCSSETENIA